jgi:tol-pal system protein YbgF
MERVIENQSLIELAARVEQLRSESQVIRGEIETLAFQTEGAADRQRELYIDVDTRLQELQESQRLIAGAMPSPEAGASLSDEAQRPVLAGSEQDNYQLAFNLLRDGRYMESASAFDQFLTVFSSSPLADNAQYWLAETYYVQRQFAMALPAFQEVVDEYPGSSKLPDALLKIGFCSYELQQLEDAQAALQRVVREFPTTTAARLATQRLERIIQEQG